MHDVVEDDKMSNVIVLQYQYNSDMSLTSIFDNSIEYQFFNQNKLT